MAAAPGRPLALESARFLTAIDVPRASGSDGWEVKASLSVLFFATAGPDARELWTTDGTIEGTVKIADVGHSEYSAGFEPQGLLVARETLFFPVGIGSASRLWRSDGTLIGTAQVSDVPLGRLSAVIREKVIFTDRLGEFWITDGSAEGTGPTSPPPSVFSRGFSIGKAHFFVSMRFGQGTLQWTYGHEGRVCCSADLGVCDAVGAERLGNGAFFTTTCTRNGPPGCLDCVAPRTTDLWRTDGTFDGTVHIASRTDVLGTTVLGETLIFQTIADGLWASDGTPEGTHVVLPGPQSAMTAAAGRAFVTVAGEDAAVLWTTDGTAAGTVPLAEIGVDRGDVARELTVVRGVVFFLAQSLSGTRGKLWRTDGTPAGTRPIGVEVHPEFPFVSALWNVHGTLLFATDDGPTGLARRELWALTACDSGPECEDGDACTVDTCRDGLCWGRPLRGYEEVACRVGALTDSPPCGSRRLPPSLRQCATTLDRLGRRATKATRAAGQRRLLRRMDLELGSLARRAARPRTVLRLGLICADAITYTAMDLRWLIAAVPE